MSNLYQALGFPVESEEELMEWVMQAAERGDPVEAAGVTYLRWHAGGGAELWLQVRDDGAIVGVEPHLHGEARMRVALTARVRQADAPAGQGSLHGWADPEDEAEAESGLYPFVFSVPDYRTCDTRPLPAVLDVQLAALAYELAAFPSEEAYLADQSGELKYAPESFIPSGLFTHDPDATATPVAIFTGRVLQAERRMNAASGAPFTWARVRTLGGEVEVAADPSIVQGEVVAGGIVTGSFWLTGRIPGHPPAAQLH